jgi:soluble lytic murein transglycosylase-like protein
MKHILRAAPAALAVVSAPAFAGDLEEALGFAAEQLDGAEPAAPRGPSAVPMLNARDVQPGAPLESYDCFDSSIDQPWTLRTKGDNRWVDNDCKRERFAQEHARGYRTLGRRRLSPQQAAPLLRRAAEESGLPLALLDGIARYTSGYRPDAISERGAVGLLQVPPEAGPTPAARRDPAENARFGARYLRGLIDRYGSMEVAIAAYAAGPEAVAKAGGFIPDRETLWLVREVLKLVENADRPFPTANAVESMVYVWTWLE